jgi:hypothetical protein
MVQGGERWSQAPGCHSLAAPTLFADRLGPAESELARELAKDPFVFDFLGLSGPVTERELGRGFAFVGRQVRFEVDGDDFSIDLLFSTSSSCATSSSSKDRHVRAGLRRPAQLLRRLGRRPALGPQHTPTIGLLLCADRNERVVRYALGGSSQPLAGSTYTFDSYANTRPYEALSPAERAALPAAAELEAALGALMEVHGRQVTLAEYLEQLAQHDGTPNESAGLEKRLLTRHGRPSNALRRARPVRRHRTELRVRPEPDWCQPRPAGALAAGWTFEQSGLAGT